MNMETVLPKTRLCVLAQGTHSRGLRPEDPADVTTEKPPVPLCQRSWHTPAQPHEQIKHCYGLQGRYDPVAKHQGSVMGSLGISGAGSSQYRESF